MELLSSEIFRLLLWCRNLIVWKPVNWQTCLGMLFVTMNALVVCIQWWVPMEQVGELADSSHREADSY